MFAVMKISNGALLFVMVGFMKLGTTHGYGTWMADGMTWANTMDRCAWSQKDTDDRWTIEMQILLPRCTYVYIFIFKHNYTFVMI